MRTETGVCMITVTILVTAFATMHKPSQDLFIFWLEKQQIPGFSYLRNEAAEKRLRVTFQAYTLADFGESVRRLEELLNTKASEILIPQKTRNHALS